MGSLPLDRIEERDALLTADGAQAVATIGREGTEPAVLEDPLGVYGERTGAARLRILPAGAGEPAAHHDAEGDRECDPSHEHDQAGPHAEPPFHRSHQCRDSLASRIAFTTANTCSCSHSGFLRDPGSKLDHQDMRSSSISITRRIVTPIP
jgi:hypothetical protein